MAGSSPAMTKEVLPNHMDHTLGSNSDPLDLPFKRYA
jgi:hypothetical protein